SLTRAPRRSRVHGVCRTYSLAILSMNVSSYSDGDFRRARRGTGLDVCANEEAASPLLDPNAPEPRGAEQEPELPLGVVVDRTVADHLVAQLPHRALEPVPAREAGHDTARADLRHSPHVEVRVGHVVEEAEREDDVEAALERRGQEVALDELHLLAEPGQPLRREVEHLLGEIDVDVLAGSRFER